MTAAAVRGSSVFTDRKKLGMREVLITVISKES